MAQAIAVIDVLKRELKARGLTYAEIARRIDMSEANVKRMFSERNFTLERIDEICAAAGIEFTELTREFDQEEHLLTELTVRQEAEIVDDPKLFLVATAVLNLMSYDDILATYTLSAAEVVGLLTRLDRIGIIELRPNNRIKLKIARTFAWIPNGPIQNTFKNHSEDFFGSDFSGATETMLLLNGRLSRAAQLALVDRLKRVAREFSAQHIEDAALPLEQRPPISLLLACRPWLPRLMHRYLRKEAAAVMEVRNR
ncbi:MAG TPA: helix-turn-helix transcriptional regulator [Burkholderiaceae bacterium]|nr:helix-turn-helix transcriptional regulator [Burkholderiaceae bacterium]